MTGKAVTFDASKNSNASDSGISLRTARYWVKRYRERSLPGLVRKERSDKDSRRLSEQLRQAIAARESLVIGAA